LEEHDELAPIGPPIRQTQDGQVGHDHTGHVHGLPCGHQREAGVSLRHFHLPVAKDEYYKGFEPACDDPAPKLGV